MENKNKQIQLYSVLRFLAILLVVFSHSTYSTIFSTYGGFDYALADYSPLFNFAVSITTFIYTFHMPLFIFISGTLFYNEIKKYSFKEFVQKKFKRLVIPYLAFGVLLVIPIKFLANYYSPAQLPNAITYGLLFGQDTVQHLWFLPCLFFVTILFYILFVVLFKENKKYLVILCAILIVFGPSIEVVFPGVKFLPLFLLSFAFGYLFNIYREKFETIKTWKAVVISIIGMVCALIGYKFLGTLAMGHIYETVHYCLALFLIVIFCFIALGLSKIQMFTNSKIFYIINKYSLEIYIIGDAINYLILYGIFLLGWNFIYDTNQGTLLMLIIRNIGIIIMAILIARKIRKWTANNKFKNIITKMFYIIVICSMALSIILPFI